MTSARTAERLEGEPTSTLPPSSPYLQSRLRPNSQLPVITCPSTHPKESGTDQVSSREATQSQPTLGRQTKTAQKARRPITPNKSLPTHQNPEINVEPVIGSPQKLMNQNFEEQPSSVGTQNYREYEGLLLDVPSISKLRDFPNLSLPAPQLNRKVKLPNSAPSSPTQKSISSGGDLLTPSTSPNRTPVIQWNPALIFSPLQRQRSSTPLGSPIDRHSTNPVGSWDNFQQDPTFFGDSQQFWQSRQIPIVSTDHSDLSDVSLLSSKASISTLDLLQSQPVGVLDTALLESQLLDQNTIKLRMSKNKASDLEKISQLETKVKDMCSNLSPEFISSQSAPSMNHELKEIGLVRDEYRNFVGQLLYYSSDITPQERNELESHMGVTLKSVQMYKFSDLEKVNQLIPPPPVTQMTKFE